MKRELSLQHQRPKKGPTWTTNQEAYQGWHDYQQTRISPTTLGHYAWEVQRFLRAWTDPAWKLNRTDLWNYVTAYAGNCTHYRRQTARPEYCNKAQDLQQCGRTCPAYQPLGYETVNHHLQAIASLYDYLDHQGLTQSNPARRVKREWARENKHRKRNTPRRIPTQDELQDLLTKRTPIHRRAIIMIFAKTGVRVGEGIRLQIDPQHLDLQNGWIHIPPFYGKRRGNRSIPIDAELQTFLAKYLQWRQDLLSRLGKTTQALLVTPRGEAYSHKNGPDSINRGLKIDQANLGLQEPYFTAHALRHYFSDQLKRNGIDDYYWNILRGDIPRGNQATYIHPTPQDIRRQYLQYRPQV